MVWLFRFIFQLDFWLKVISVKAASQPPKISKYATKKRVRSQLSVFWLNIALCVLNQTDSLSLVAVNQPGLFFALYSSCIGVSHTTTCCCRMAKLATELCEFSYIVLKLGFPEDFVSLAFVWNKKKEIIKAFASIKGHAEARSSHGLWFELLWLGTFEGGTNLF